MPSPFHGIDTASRALRAFQRELDVTGHNIANVNTRGYSRQAVDLNSSEGVLTSEGRMLMLGSGVTISSVNRIRDLFLDARRQAGLAEMGRFESLHQGLSRVETMFVDAQGAGVSDSLTKFFNAWSALGNNPGDPALKQQVQMTASTLAERVRGAYKQLQAVKDEQLGQISQTFINIQKMADEIGRLNHEIREKMALGAMPNDLLDQRDLLIADLNKLVDVSTVRQKDNTIAVYIDGYAIVDSHGSRSVPTDFDPDSATLSSGSLTMKIRGGQLAGLLESAKKIGSYQLRLDNLADTLRAQVNGVHQGGLNVAGDSGLSFFNTASGAISFGLDAAIEADANAIAAGTTGAASDGSIALQISKLRETSIPALGGRNFVSYFTDVISEVGRDVLGARGSLETQSSILQQIDNQIQSVSGVSIDDEMANMLRFQRSYQAAAKALTVFDQATETLIDMLRR